MEGLGEYGYSAKIDSQGRIIVVGYRNTGSDELLVIYRFLENGSLDRSFGYGDSSVADGVQVWGSELGFNSPKVKGHDLIIDSGGRIVVVGTSGEDSEPPMLTLWRFMPNGDIDFTFANGSSRISSVKPFQDAQGRFSLVSDELDGYYVVGQGDPNGGARPAVKHFDELGALDEGFAFNPAAVAYATGAGGASRVTLDANGGLLVCGNRETGGEAFHQVPIVFRLNSNGTLDETFDSDGVLEIPFKADGSDDTWRVVSATDIVLDSWGNMIVAGRGMDIIVGNPLLVPTIYSTFVWKFTAENVLEESFGVDGEFFLGPVSSGYGDKFYPANRIALDSFGRILLAGQTQLSPELYNEANVLIKMVDMSLIRIK